MCGPWADVDLERHIGEGESPVHDNAGYLRRVGLLGPPLGVAGQIQSFNTTAKCRAIWPSWLSVAKSKM